MVSLGSLYNATIRYELYFKRYILQWISAFAIFFTSGYMELNIKPFQRRFSLSNQAINYPFTEHEQFTNIKLGIYAVLLPYTIMMLIILIKFIQNPKQKSKYIHLANITTLAFFLSLSLNGFITEFLKLRIGKLRPDFLARCGPSKGLSMLQNYRVDVCTDPFGKFLTMDGFKSCPSGHSSFSWCGLTFLNLWIMGQFNIYSTGSITAGRFRLVKLLNLLPVLLCFHIAISRSQDYRHDYTDITLGTIIGLSVSTFIYRQFFNSIYAETSDLTPFDDDHKVLDVSEDVRLPR